MILVKKTSAILLIFVELTTLVKKTLVILLISVELITLVKKGHCVDIC
jgi:hypothetical protein